MENKLLEFCKRKYPSVFNNAYGYERDKQYNELRDELSDFIGLVLNDVIIYYKKYNIEYFIKTYREFIKHHERLSNNSFGDFYYSFGEFVFDDNNVHFTYNPNNGIGIMNIYIKDDGSNLECRIKHDNYDLSFGNKGYFYNEFDIIEHLIIMMENVLEEINQK